MWKKSPFIEFSMNAQRHQRDFIKINRAQILEGKQHGLFLPGCPKPLKNPLASQFAVKAGVSWEGFVPRTHLP